MKLGCSTLLYGKLPLATALGGISKAGYAAIELCAIPGMSPHVSPELDADGRKAVRDLVAGYGLAIESIGASGWFDYQNPDKLISILQLAADLGAPAVTSGAGGADGDEESYQALLKVLRERLLGPAEELGVVISLKPHVGNYVCRRESILRFGSDLDSPWVGVNIDPSHLFRTDPELDPEETIALCGKHIRTGRIRDTRERVAAVGPPQNQVPGGGAINLPAVVKAYREHTKLDYLTVEIVGAHAWDDAFECQKIVDACALVLKPMVES